ncbi:MAG: DDE-type integrase/transposase/recombinase [Bacteroidia bacterium]
MDTTKLISPADIKTFLDGICNIQSNDKFVITPVENPRQWLPEILKATLYNTLSKKDKSIVLEYLRLMTSYSRAQLTRLLSQYKKTGSLERSRTKCFTFAKKYTREDILLLAEIDATHDHLSGALTKKLFERAFYKFKDKAFERLAHISVSHIYNLRTGKTYQRKRTFISKTKPNKVRLGCRKKPQPNNKPGYLRVDTVHQGDKDGKKGIYYINAVDEVTQFEVISCVEKITENLLIPVLENMLAAFPFIIINFHSDNGSEYINRHVVKMLNKLNVSLTKGRARHSNDNALAESKNGSIIRKHLGYVHIPQRWAPDMDEFLQSYFNPYINFHRPCYFAVTKVDHKGKERKAYPYENIETPYDKLKSLPDAQQYLKPGESFEALDKKAMEHNDTEAARLMTDAKDKLFRTIFAGFEDNLLKPK